MNTQHEIDQAVGALLGGRDTTADAARGRARAQQRLGEAIAGTRRASRQRVRIARPRHAVALACAVLLVSGVAVAATTEFAARILGSTEPPAKRIGAIRDDPRPDLTQEQIVEQFHGAFVQEQVGDRLSLELSEPLVQDEHARLSARRTAEGAVCMELFELGTYVADEPASWHLGSASCGAFADGWPVMDVIGGDGMTGSISYGLVADGVAQVRFVVDGTPRDAQMGTSSFLWRTPDGVEPTAIEAVLDDGTVVSRDLTWNVASGTPRPRPQVHWMGQRKEDVLLQQSGN